MSLRKVFVTLTGHEILRERGRLPYPLLHSFVTAGYEVRVLDNLKSTLTELHRVDEVSLPEPVHLLLRMRGVTFASDFPEDSENYDYLFDWPLEGATGRRWHRQLRIAYDLFSAYRLHAPIIAPYAMFPAHLESATPEVLADLRVQSRRMRVFFAGDSKGYARSWVRYPDPKLPRQEVLNVLRAGVPGQMVEVNGLDEIDRLLAGGFVDRFVLSDSGSGIPQASWLSTMARADFFLCPPGIVMPMCHNVIEAMAVGTIPLIGYPEWFHPNLEHGKNCITFDDRASLVERMRLVMSLSSAQVEAMRAEVVRYYDDYLRPGRLVEAIEQRSERDLTILIHTELNMARNAKKLGRHSVIIKGPQANGPWRRFGRAIDRLRHGVAGI